LPVIVSSFHSTSAFLCFFSFFVHVFCWMPSSIVKLWIVYGYWRALSSSRLVRDPQAFWSRWKSLRIALSVPHVVTSNRQLCDIWGSQGDEYGDVLLGCDAMSTRRYHSFVKRNIRSPSWRLKMKQYVSRNVGINLRMCMASQLSTTASSIRKICSRGTSMAYLVISWPCTTNSGTLFTTSVTQKTLLYKSYWHYRTWR
jgi:hypothetical protein